MAITVRTIKSEAEREACYAVRIRVFVDEQQFPLAGEIDAADETALHFLALEGDEVIGTARMLRRGDGIGQIGRVAVLREWRGQGIGRKLMERAMEEAFADCHTIFIDSQIGAIPFYEKLGFIAEGALVQDCGVDHQPMFCRRDA